MSSKWFTEALTHLEGGLEIPEAVLAAGIRALTRPDFDRAEGEMFLRRLAQRGETTKEIVVAARVLREQMVSLPTNRTPILDTCGTGGDHSGTFNISTAVSLVLAASGVPVVKHGNRSASSQSGSADVLATLGVPIERGVEWASETLATLNYAFCFAPQYHPTLKHVGLLRREMKIRTIFNLLGPLLNPARATHQLLGVASQELLPILAAAVMELGITSAFLIRSRDGLDEVSLAAPTDVLVVRDGKITEWTWLPNDFGLEPIRLEEIKVDSPQASAAVVQNLLRGEPGPARRIVLANAAAGLLLVNHVDSLRHGVDRAAEAIDSGKASQLLDRLCATNLS